MTNTITQKKQAVATEHPHRHGYDETQIPPCLGNGGEICHWDASNRCGGFTKECLEERYTHCDAQMKLNIKIWILNDCSPEGFSFFVCFQIKHLSSIFFFNFL